MLGLCDPSNFLLFEYSFYPPRSDALFSNYFEDLLTKVKDFPRSQTVTYSGLETVIGL